jgi:hypothetical protein
MKLSMRIHRCLFTAAAFAVSASAIASAQYTYTNITIPGSTGTKAGGISNKDEIVGYYTTGSSDSPVYHGFWRTNDHPALLQYPYDDPKGAGVTEFYSINSGRMVVGAYQTAQPVTDGLYLNGGEYTTFNVPGQLATWINGISDVGELVGSCPTGSGGQVGWLYTHAGGFDVFSYPGASSTFVEAVSTNGTIVGGYNDSFNNVHGFMRAANGTFTTVDFPGNVGSYLTGISDTGLIAGTFWDDIGYHGFLLQSGVFTEIDVPGQFNTQLGQINKHGWFVGSYLTKHGKSIAFFAKPTK